jgi:cell division protein ZipA
MTELRWVLLALGVLVIVVIYFWERGLAQFWSSLRSRLRKPQMPRAERVEPELGSSTRKDPGHAEPAEPLEHEPAPADSIVTLRFVPSDGSISADQVILALRASGLRHGRYGIFHKHASAISDDALFSVANLTEPGSFDLSRLTETKIPGMSFFMILPGVGDPVERFDQMVATARHLARELGGELKDENGSSWSIQRERYVREEIIEYVHMLDRPRLD